MHLFYFCPYVAKFWVSIQLWLRSMDILFYEPHLRIFRCVFEGKCTHFFNMIILMGKMFILKLKLYKMYV